MAFSLSLAIKEFRENKRSIFQVVGAMATAWRGHVLQDAWPRQAVAMAPEIERLFPRSALP